MNIYIERVLLLFLAIFAISINLDDEKDISVKDFKDMTCTKHEIAFKKAMSFALVRSTCIEAYH